MTLGLACGWRESDVMLTTQLEAGRFPAGLYGRAWDLAVAGRAGAGRFRQNQRGPRNPRMESMNDVKKIWMPATSTVAATSAHWPSPRVPSP